MPAIPIPTLPYGVCSQCLHVKLLTSDKGSVFMQCQRGLTDARFPKYPRLPVLRCAGFVALAKPSVASPASGTQLPENGFADFDDSGDS